MMPGNKDAPSPHPHHLVECWNNFLGNSFSYKHYILIYILKLHVVYFPLFWVMPFCQKSNIIKLTKFDLSVVQVLFFFNVLVVIF